MTLGVSSVTRIGRSRKRSCPNRLPRVFGAGRKKRARDFNMTEIVHHTVMEAPCCEKGYIQIVPSLSKKQELAKMYNADTMQRMDMASEILRP